MKPMISNSGPNRLLLAVSLAAVCTAFLFDGRALGADGDPREATLERPDRPELSLTMRIIEDPDALGADAVTRRLSLPPPGLREGGMRPANDENDTTKGAPPGREEGRPLREQASERAREMAEQARERRENFGRSRAEDLRPERPEPPEPRRPPGRP